ncbi:MAG: hypothetical protein Sv326_0161 [Candidatus Fermentimicrarchaeum limneticum]|uniref:Type 4 fimbrial biogenesis protein PilX N-terminal domain-containing protein n=1 Tax=Fermentimicrarchaeum limneticum TaxID=2795018 RepID=A0A7D6BKZ5_FERL1|nr:MAG: hypothetical protein Sv326_0161 [Candidatus Fermentimicrarchaeum limneticum]
MRRGIVFMLDALVAVVLAVMALAVVAQLLSLRTGEWYKEIALYNYAQDFMTSRDKDGTLKGTFDQTDADAQITLNNLMAIQIPPNMVARINVTVCRYQSGFVCDRNFTAGQSSSSRTKSVVRRIFTDTNNSKYGVAVMEVWYK